MLKWYRKAGLGLLHFLNYNKIENEGGSNHIILNLIDLLLALSYAGISIWKLNSVTLLVLVINLLTLARLIVGNFKKTINLRDKYKEKYLKKPGLLYKSAYDLKLVVEFCVIAFSLMPFWIQGKLQEDSVIRAFAGIIIVLGFLENYINIQAELFKANIEV